jgi:ribosomal protein S12 methylthiotransferase accessory factor
MSAILAGSGETRAWFEHGERSRPAVETVERLRPHLPALGITRLARQTGLDHIGIPCFAAMRPMGLTLSVTQGKGHDDFSAMASALMEAAEYCVVESPRCAVRVATAGELAAEDTQIFNPRRLLPRGVELPGNVALCWVRGRSWPAGETVWMPLDAVTLGMPARDLATISRSSNGLASGNTADEALFHAICELVERDATALWSLQQDAVKLATEFAPSIVTEAIAARMRAHIADAGLELRLFDQTTDLGVPCVMAVILDQAAGAPRRFDAAAGYGCHPVGARAIVRAVSEAAQTRITNIAGARDDFLPAEYFECPDNSTGFLMKPREQEARIPQWLPEETPVPVLLDRLAQRIGSAARLVWTELGGADYGISVIRVLSDTLEDREANSNWRPGRRAFRALAGA